MTLTGWPATVTVAVRDEDEVLAANVKPTVPFPDPDAPEVMVIQEALPVAVHVHPSGAVTLTLPESPPEADDNEVGDAV